MRLPCQLDNSQAISRRFWLDKDILLSADSRRHVLIISPVPARKTGVLADVLFAFLVEPLALAVELGCGG